MIAYMDLPSGLSGDMFLGCLVDAGWPLAELRATVARLKLPADSWQVEEARVMRGPLAATHVRVSVVEGDAHRHLHHVAAIIEQADLPVPVQQRAVAVFRRLAEAEAAVHGSTVESVHFHEVGALDAIVDIVGVCAGLEALGITRLYAGGVPLGEGWVNSAHGQIPVPAPATLALLAAVGAPTRLAPGPGELVTPTGAALLAELAEFRQPPMRLRCIGLGAGSKDFAWPNVARLWLGDGDSWPLGQSSLVVLETNIDDMNPELYAGARHALTAAGALDVWTTPIQMKKERPGILLSVLAPTEREQELVRVILRETTSLGVRSRVVTRYEAARAMSTVATAYGPIPVKVKQVDGVTIGAKPEHDACAAAAQEAGVPVRWVYEAAMAAAHRSEQTA